MSLFVTTMTLFYYVGYYTALFLIPFIIYFLLFKKNNGRSLYSKRDWFYFIKLYFAKKEVKQYQAKYRRLLSNDGANDFEPGGEIPTKNYSIMQSIFAVDQKGNSLSLKFIVKYEKIAEVDLRLSIVDGNCYVFPGNSRIYHNKIPKQDWKVNGLNIETLEPFRRFRIVFNGLLQNITNEEYEKVEHVQFNFIFNASGSPTFIPHGMDAALLAEALVRETWQDGSWKDFLVDQSGYEQFGALQGFVKGDSYPNELVLNLGTIRAKQKGIDDRFLLNKGLRIFMADAYGNMVNLVIKSFNNGCSELNYGSAILSNNKILPITGLDILLRNMGQRETIPETIVMHVQVLSKLFICVIHLNKAKAVLSTNNEENGFECYNIPAECEINENQGHAILEFWYRKKGDEKIVIDDMLSCKTTDILPNLIVSNIKDEESKILALTGGKGNSLALLASRNSPDYIIPDGFIITVNAFQQQLESSPTLLKAISLLSAVSCGKESGKLKDICRETVDCFKKEKIIPDIVEAITKELRDIKGGFNEGETISWAVRSSAIGEDSDQLSAAGQNGTFLGCLTLEQVLESVVACWASLFTFQSVQYRREHGLPILTNMAVVVQNMVPADVAGVLFTCHPSTSNPSQMVLTANFGLGESVVSGTSDPDTIILNRTWDDKICVIDSRIGDKNKIIKMTDKGLKEIDRENNYNSVPMQDCSVTELQALQLGKAGIQLEKAFGNPQDIEFAFYKDQLYLLQSRPITTLNSWSEFELTHEMDYPILSDKLVFSVANVGEVLPDSMTVLSQTSIVTMIDRAMQEHSHLHYDPLVSKAICTVQHRGMLEIITTIHRNVQDEVKLASKIMDLAIFGHPVFDDKIHKIAKNRLGVSSTLDQLLLTLDIISLARHNHKTYDVIKENASKFKINITDRDSPLTIHKKIRDSFEEIHQFVLFHTHTSSVGIFYEIIAMSVLCGGSKELSMEHYSDFALILSSCEDVVSAEIPKYFENIAKIVRDEGYGEEFCTIKPEFGVAWLKTKCPEAYTVFEEFLKHHGHRNLGEFEVMEETWSENPSKVIPMIQANVRYERKVGKTHLSIDEMVKKLASSKNAVIRYVLKWLTKKIRSAVGLRELSKSEVVRAFSALKLAYRELAKRMVLDGLLPSVDLVYHLTHYEIGEIIQNNNPLLIKKAIKRQRLYTKWCKFRFPEVMFGTPVPEQDETFHVDSNSNSVVCIGTPVCIGCAKARACVIKNLDGIDQLQLGDILITYSTDIGWSPYFPMLSGLVTELGGLISHGAVIAREYGLPCIVGVKNATNIFKTGDIVILSANTGEIMKN